MIEDAIRALLIAPGSATQAIVGSRVYPERLPQTGDGAQSPLPAIVYKLVSAPQEYHHKGPRWLIEARIQLDFATDTYGQAQALAAAIRGRRGVPGVLSGRQAKVEFQGSERTVSIRRIFVRMERDSGESDLDNVGASPRGKSLDIGVWFWER
jgi:hypothetical protein